MIPDDLLYAKTHEWVSLKDDSTAQIGITHFAQEQLGDLTFVELPAEGDSIEAGQEMGAVESVKAASELYAPVSGKVTAVNSVLEDNPGLANEDPYGEGWMIEVQLSAPAEGLLSPAQYAELVEAEDH